MHKIVLAGHVCPDMMRNGYPDYRSADDYRMIYMPRGMNVLLAKNTRLALPGGTSSCVHFELSTPSMD